MSYTAKFWIPLANMVVGKFEFIDSPAKVVLL